MRYDVEHDCEDNTFVRTDLSADEAASRQAELTADDTVSNVRIVERRGR